MQSKPHSENFMFRNDEQDTKWLSKQFLDN